MHRTEGIRAGAAQQLQQYGFHLIIAVVRQHQSFAFAQMRGKRGVTRLACGGFKAHAAAGVDAYAKHFARHRQGRA